MNAQAHSTYTHKLRAELAPDAFQPSAKALWLFAVHLALIGVGFAGLILGLGGNWAIAGWTLLIGHSFGGIAFLGHEILHGSVVKGRRLQNVLGFICYLPFALSPTLWRAWHNRVHHGNTMIAGVDPDAFPTLDVYQASPAVQVMERFAIAKGHLFGWLSFAVGFTGQSTQILMNSRARGYLKPAEHRRALVEWAAGLAFWAAIGVAFGWKVFAFGFLVPHVIANSIVMAYIYTNHHLSPLTEVNDPLLNSLTVTVPSLFDRLHARFGLHVEHHLFPSMRQDQLVVVRDLLKKHWPERYQSMSLVEALRRLASTPRIYRAPTELVCPRTGFVSPALMPRS